MLVVFRMNETKVNIHFTKALPSLSPNITEKNNWKKHVSKNSQITEAGKHQKQFQHKPTTKKSIRNNDNENASRRATQQQQQQQQKMGMKTQTRKTQIEEVLAENSKIVWIRYYVMLPCFFSSRFRWYSVSIQQFYNVRMLNKNDKIHSFQFGHLVAKSKRRRRTCGRGFSFIFFFYSTISKITLLNPIRCNILVPLFCRSLKRNCPMKMIVQWNASKKWKHCITKSNRMIKMK